MLQGGDLLRIVRIRRVASPPVGAGVHDPQVCAQLLGDLAGRPDEGTRRRGVPHTHGDHLGALVLAPPGRGHDEHRHGRPTGDAVDDRPHRVADPRVGAALEQHHAGVRARLVECGGGTVVDQLGRDAQLVAQQLLELLGGADQHVGAGVLHRAAADRQLGPVTVAGTRRDRMHEVHAALATYRLRGGELEHAVDVVRLADSDEDLARFHVQH